MFVNVALIFSWECGQISKKQKENTLWIWSLGCSHYLGTITKETWPWNAAKGAKMSVSKFTMS